MILLLHFKIKEEEKMAGKNLVLNFFCPHGCRNKPIVEASKTTQGKMVDAVSFAFDAIYLKTQVFSVTKAFLQVGFCVFQNIFSHIVTEI
jgi:hypothetical protein